MNTSRLALVRHREREIESQLTEPCTGRIVASTAFVRRLIEEMRKSGQEVQQNADLYTFGDVMIQADGRLQGDAFVILLSPE